MPDVRVPGPALNSLPGASHTGSQQWQSFEMRMRQRRAERCRLRAEAAIDAGLCEEARGALEEARRLQPELPFLTETEAKLADAERPKTPEAPGGSGAITLQGGQAAERGALLPISDGRDFRDSLGEEQLRPAAGPVPGLLPGTRERVASSGAGARAAAIMLSVVAALGFGAWMMMRDPAPQRAGVQEPTPAGSATVSRLPDGAPGDQVPPEVIGLVDATPATPDAAQPIVPPLADDRAQQSPVAEESLAERLPSAATEMLASPSDSAVPSTEPPPPAPAPRPEVSSVERPTAPIETSPLPPATTALPPPITAMPAAMPPAVTPTASTPSAPLTSPPAALDAAAGSRPQPEAETRAQADPGAPIAAPPSADVQIRGVLARYERAYSELDVTAARAVWPTVNAPALGRAFDSLASQRVSLGSCSIAPSAAGRSARADCSGSATWTPKVGGRTRTEARSWTFELQATGDQWQIVRATTR